MRFRDIPQLTRTKYHIDVHWFYLESWIEDTRKYGDLQLDPPFQREHIWTQTQQIKYVEFVLRGGQSAKEIYWNNSMWMKWTESNLDAPTYLVDGKQRLQAVRLFMSDQLPIFGNNYKSDFTDHLPMDLGRFHFYINDLPTYADVLNWYLEINSGGIAHTEEELDKVRRMLEDENV